MSDCGACSVELWALLWSGILAFTSISLFYAYQLYCKYKDRQREELRTQATMAVTHLLRMVRQLGLFKHQSLFQNQIDDFVLRNNKRKKPMKSDE